MQAARSSVQRDATRMVLMLMLMFILMASLCMMVAGFGVINYLNGYPLRALTSLIVPTFLGYWAWQVRDNMDMEPLIPIFGVVWLAGLPVGWAVHAINQWIG